MVSPQTGRLRGRPPYDFLHDPERYAIAFIDALVAHGTSETDAFRIASSQIVGMPKGTPNHRASAKTGARSGIRWGADQLSMARPRLREGRHASP